MRANTYDRMENAKQTMETDIQWAMISFKCTKIVMQSIPFCEIHAKVCLSVKKRFIKFIQENDKV